MSKLKRDLKTEPIPDKAMRGAQIITACTGNSNIGTVTTELTAFTTANTKLETDYNAAQAAAAHAIQLTTVQNDSDADWNAKLESLALVLERNTGGDKMKLETTTIDTFEPGRAPAVGAPAKVDNVKVTLGDMPHELEVTWDGLQPRPQMYLVKMCEDPYDATKLAQVGMVTGSRLVKGGLTGGKTYWFVIVAVGTGGRQGPPSDPATGMAT